MPGFSDGIWDISSQWTEENYIRPGRMMGFWKILCPFWASKNGCGGCRWNFFWVVQENFQGTLLLMVHAVTRGDHTSIINAVFRW